MLVFSFSKKLINVFSVLCFVLFFDSSAFLVSLLFNFGFYFQGFHCNWED